METQTLEKTEYASEMEMALVELLNALRNYNNALKLTGKFGNETVRLLKAELETAFETPREDDEDTPEVEIIPADNFESPSESDKNGQF